ncbi:MAG TPA: amidohydrolase family protein [Vicinamibacteria bacterium]|nr:amidohydrolase family protein [Vicinamibacteria bacterium]
MKRWIFAAAWPLALAGPAHAQPSPQPTPSPEVTVLKAARLFDGTKDTLVTNGVVVVEGGRIQAVGSGLSVPAGATVIDLGDATLLPGIIDAHVHLTGESGDDWYKEAVEGLRRGIPEQAIRSTEYAKRTLMAGVTTVRNVGAADFVDVGLRNAINAGVVPGPRMLIAGNSLGARGGHCDETGFPYMLFGRETGLAQGIAAGPDGFRDAVRFAIKYGADVIKVCATGGVLSLGDAVDTPQLTQAEMDALVDEAHRLGHKTAAHAHGATGAKVAIRAGIDSIEHGSFLDDEAVRLMKEKGTYLVPTAMAVDYTARRPRNYPPEIAAKAKAAGDSHTAALKRAVAAGVKIAFGTDSAVSPHGRNAEEFGLLVQYGGLTPAAALRTVAASAVLLGIEKDAGTLEPGKQADVIAVPGDVLADVRATEKVLFVMKGGKVYRNDRAR